VNVYAIVKKIEDLALGVAGQSLFVHEMPAECKVGILVRLPLTGIKIDHELPGYHRGSTQFIVRAPSHTVGQPLADALLAAFTLNEVTLLDAEGKGMHLKHMLPKTLPIVYRRSDGNGVEWSINFELAYTRID
jgi:hypothetical protein